MYDILLYYHILFTVHIYVLFIVSKQKKIQIGKENHQLQKNYVIQCTSALTCISEQQVNRNKIIFSKNKII